MKTYASSGPQPLAAGNYYLLSDLLYRSAALTNVSAARSSRRTTPTPTATRLLFNGPGTDTTWFTNDDAQAAYAACRYVFTGSEYDAETPNLLLPGTERFAGARTLLEAGTKWSLGIFTNSPQGHPPATRTQPVTGRCLLLRRHPPHRLPRRPFRHFCTTRVVQGVSEAEEIEELERFSLLGPAVVAWWFLFGPGCSTAGGPDAPPMPVPPVKRPKPPPKTPGRCICPVPIDADVLSSECGEAIPRWRAL